MSLNITVYINGYMHHNWIWLFSNHVHFLLTTFFNSFMYSTGIMFVRPRLLVACHTLPHVLSSLAPFFTCNPWDCDDISFQRLPFFFSIFILVHVALLWLLCLWHILLTSCASEQPVYWDQSLTWSRSTQTADPSGWLFFFFLSYFATSALPHHSSCTVWPVCVSLFALLQPIRASERHDRVVVSYTVLQASGLLF